MSRPQREEEARDWRLHVITLRTGRRRWRGQSETSRTSRLPHVFTLYVVCVGHGNVSESPPLASFVKAACGSITTLSLGGFFRSLSLVDLASCHRLQDLTLKATVHSSFAGFVEPGWPAMPLTVQSTPAALRRLTLQISLVFDLVGDVETPVHTQIASRLQDLDWSTLDTFSTRIRTWRK